MNKEDYFKYYIQGSDHYLIPKDVFNELFDEMGNWKEEAKELNQKYLNAVADYETTMSELQELKKQLEEYKLITIDYQELEARNQELKLQLKGTTHCFDEEEHEKLKKQLEELKEEKQEWINLLAMFKNQQKEFIEYMNKTIEELECDDVGDEEMKGYLIQRIDTFKEILQKYKEIIGDK